jgi:hypothetical protein
MRQVVARWRGQESVWYVESSACVDKNAPAEVRHYDTARAAQDMTA